MFSKKYFLIGIGLGIILLFVYIATLPDGKLHIVFCDVGQGDAAYIRTQSNQDMLIDGGPNDKVLTCLGKYMPFYDRTIDVVVMTHPQKDHMQGLLSVLERYRVNFFIAGVEKNEAEGYARLLTILQSKKVPVKNLYAGESFRLGELDVNVLWPKREWVAAHTDVSNRVALLRQDYGGQAMKQWNNPPAGEAGETIGETVLGLSTDTDLNDFSYYMHLIYGTFDALLTGDGDQRIQPEIMKSALPDVEVLKFPHHGSKTGILPEFLEKIKPEFAVISVGKNSYGHPTNEAIELLNDRGVKVSRTDIEGNVEVVSDGKGWWVK